MDKDSDRYGIPGTRGKCPSQPEVYNHPDKTPQTAANFRNRYLATGCCAVHPRTCRRERALHHGLQPGDPVLVLVRVQTRDCAR